MTQDIQEQRRLQEAHTQDIQEQLRTFSSEVKTELGAFKEQLKTLRDASERKAARAELEHRIELLASQRQFRYSAVHVEGFKQQLEQSHLAEAGIWAFKVALALSVAFPGHLALAELLQFSGSYLGGMKFYPMAWLPIAAMLLVAEYFVILGATYFLTAKDHKLFLDGGYQINHYNRGLGFNLVTFQQVREKYMASVGCWAIAGLICALDGIFNVRYMLERTEDWFMSLLASGFFTALLVGLSLLLAIVFEYRRSQIKLVVESADYVPDEPKAKTAPLTKPDKTYEGFLTGSYPEPKPTISKVIPPTEPKSPPPAVPSLPPLPPRTLIAHRGTPAPSPFAELPKPVVQPVKAPEVLEASPVREEQAPVVQAQPVTEPAPATPGADVKQHLQPHGVTRLRTLSQRAEFDYEITPDTIVFYPKGNTSLPLRVSFDVIQRLADEFRGRQDFVDLGTSFTVPPEGSLGDRLMKLHGQNIATYLGPVLKQAGLIETQGSHPIQFRFR